MKDLEYKYICIYTYKTKGSHKKCIVGVQVLYWGLGWEISSTDIIKVTVKEAKGQFGACVFSQWEAHLGMLLPQLSLCPRGGWSGPALWGHTSRGTHGNALESSLQALPRCLQWGWWQIWGQEDVCLRIRGVKTLTYFPSASTARMAAARYPQPTQARV